MLIFQRSEVVKLSTQKVDENTKNNRHTRKLVNAIHNESLLDVEYEEMPLFGLKIPKSAPGVPSEILNPKKAWKDGKAYDTALEKLYELFRANFVEYADRCPLEVRQAGPYF